jgi:hypothetical protein
MKDISLVDCIEFQDCFLYDGHFQPFETVKRYETYYPLALIGEFGGMIDLACKRVRSANLYTEQLTDECADMFVYLLLFGRMLEIHKEIKVLGLIDQNWSKMPDIIITDETFPMATSAFLQTLSELLRAEGIHPFTEHFFLRIFEHIKCFNRYLAQQEWQETINEFHYTALLKYTTPSAYTIDGRYKGTTHVDFRKLQCFIERIGVDIPLKRAAFLQRLIAWQDDHP